MYKTKKRTIKDYLISMYHIVKMVFPIIYRLLKNNVIIRKHNDINLIKCEELWWEEFKSGCKRDQVCFPYARWKTNYDNIMLMEYIIKEKIFKWRPHIKNV